MKHLAGGRSEIRRHTPSRHPLRCSLATNIERLRSLNGPASSRVVEATFFGSQEISIPRSDSWAARFHHDFLDVFCYVCAAPLVCLCSGNAGGSESASVRVHVVVSTINYRATYGGNLQAGSRIYSSGSFW